MNAVVIFTPRVPNDYIRNRWTNVAFVLPALSHGCIDVFQLYNGRFYSFAEIKNVFIHLLQQRKYFRCFRRRIIQCLFPDTIVLKIAKNVLLFYKSR